MISDTADVGIALGMGEACGQREKNWSTLLRDIASANGCLALADAPLYAPHQNELQKRRDTGVNGT